jgi:hypothetical protein
MSWDKVFGLTSLGSPSAVKTRSDNLAVFKAVRFGFLGIHYPPLTSVGSSMLDCHCRRSAEFSVGCIVCYAVEIGNMKRRVDELGGDWKNMILKYFNLYVFPQIDGKCSLIELLPIGKIFFSIFSILLSILTSSQDRWQSLIDTIESVKCTDGDLSIGPLLWELFRFELERVEGRRVFEEPLEMIAKNSGILAERNPEALISFRAKTEVEGPTLPLPEETLWPIYHIYNKRKVLESRARELGRFSVDKNMGENLSKLHETVLLHSTLVVESLCVEALDAFYEIQSEERLVDLISQVLESEEFRVWIPSEEKSRRSMNVYTKLEGIEFSKKQISAYSEPFRLLLTVEYGVYCLSRCWTLLKTWKTCVGIYQVWWSLKNHLGSIVQFFRVSAIENNQQQLLKELEESSSYLDQLAIHVDFLDRIKRDLFLKPPGEPYRNAIVELARIAVCFRFIIQRSFAFQRDEDDVLFELEHLVGDLRTATSFLRDNLKSTVWI